MSTKIVIIQLKEIIYTAIFVGLGILLILLLVFMFTPKKNNNVITSMNYVPGVYTSSIMLYNKAVNVEVIVDDNKINSVQLTDLDPAVETLCPVLQPAMDNISTQLANNISLEDISVNSDKKVTSSLLVDAIKSALEKAEDKH